MSMTSRLEAVFDGSNRSEAKKLAGEPNGEPTVADTGRHQATSSHYRCSDVTVSPWNLRARPLAAVPAFATGPRRQSGERTSPDPGDVNTRVRNIDAKLQARDRFSAVPRVRELRLLAAGPGR
jgi:hypothetical protein